MRFRGRPGTFMLGIILSNHEIREHDVRRSVREGYLIIRRATTDPLHSISIQAFSDFKYTTGRADCTAVSVDELCVGETYLPHLIGRHSKDIRIHKVGGSVDRAQG